MQPIFQRYLRLLGIDGQPTGLAGLKVLAQRHLWRVPFENVSKLLLFDREGAGRPLTLSEFLDGIEFLDLGGTCYSNNPFLTDLLRELGYDAELLGADMSKPNVHACVRVHINAVAYHVDAGFAAPFREPIRLDRLPAQVDEGENRYVLDRDGYGFRMRVSSGGNPVIDYVAHDPPQQREFFDPVVRNSFALTSLFMKSLRISRVFETHSIDLIDRRLFRHEGGRTTVERLTSMSELMKAVHTELQMPRCPVDRAIAVLERLTGKAFFDA